MMVMLIALVSMSACGNDDNPANETPATAQSYFYYYKDQKIPLTLNENNFCINIEGTVPFHVFPGHPHSGGRADLAGGFSDKSFILVIGIAPHPVGRKAV